MQRIEELFRRKQQRVLSIYYTAGYPGLSDTAPIALALEKAGADLIEIGMPYSDPLADGPTIQQSGQQALANGMTLALLFDQISGLRAQTRLPLVLMGYFNQVMQFGEADFFRTCREVGVDGLILPDLPVDEYERHYRKLVEENDLGISFLITPQTAPERIRRIDALTRGFLYVVADYSITGTSAGISGNQIEYFRRIRDMDLKNPQLIGFGIADHSSFDQACEYAAGAIVGSAFIRALAADGVLPSQIDRFIKNLRSEG